MFHYDNSQSMLAYSACDLIEREERQKIEENRRYLQGVRQQQEAKAPLYKELQTHSRLLQSQVASQQDEIQILKMQLETLQKDSENAQKSAKRSKIFSIISFVVSTCISLTAILVSVLTSVIG